MQPISKFFHRPNMLVCYVNFLISNCDTQVFSNSHNRRQQKRIKRKKGIAITTTRTSQAKCIANSHNLHQFRAFQQLPYPAFLHALTSKLCWQLLAVELFFVFLLQFLRTHTHIRSHCMQNLTKTTHTLHLQA